MTISFGNGVLLQRSKTLSPYSLASSSFLVLLAWRSALGEREVADRERLQAADDDEAAEVAAVVGDVVIPLDHVRGGRRGEDLELLELLLVLGENPAREMWRRRRGEVRTPGTNAATLSSATKQWFRPQIPASRRVDGVEETSN